MGARASLKILAFASEDPPGGFGTTNVIGPKGYD